MPKLAVHVKPLAEREVDYRPRHVAAHVLIADPVGRSRIENDVVEALLGLTPTQAEIAALLAGGRTLPRIAAETGRGYSTVRTLSPVTRKSFRPATATSTNCTSNGSQQDGGGGFLIATGRGSREPKTMSIAPIRCDQYW